VFRAANAWDGHGRRAPHPEALFLAAAGGMIQLVTGIVSTIWALTATETLMGQLVEGHWRSDEVGAEADGRFKRQKSRFRSWVTADGAPGPAGDGGFAAEPGRYQLYVSLACPWAHRTLILRRLKGLQDMIGVTVVHWLMRDDGWTFREGPCVTGDPILGARFLHQVYTAADPLYSGKVTVPVLWDKKRGTIVSNESADILRMFNSAFDELGAG